MCNVITTPGLRSHARGPFLQPFWAYGLGFTDYDLGGGQSPASGGSKNGRMRPLKYCFLSDDDLKP